MSEMLKPCPFCGCKGELDFAGKSFTYIDKSGETQDVHFFYTIKCTNDLCGCSVGVFENTKLAIAAWNRRIE